MKDGFFKSMKNFFNTKAGVKNIETSIKSEVPRVVSFGKEEEKKGDVELDVPIDVIEEVADSRYEKVEVKESFKDLNLKKDEVCEGETLIMVDKQFVLCKMHHHKYQVITLILTDYKLFIKTKDSLTYFPLGKIQKLHKYTNNQNFFKLLIDLKDGRKYKFRILIESAWKKIYEQIQRFTFIRVKKYFFAFKHYESNKKLEEEENGWKIYDVQKEFERMGIKIMPHSDEPIQEYTSDFKFLDNKEGRICSTYAEKLIVPSRIPNDSLIRCAKFRSRCRMPSLSYAYEYQSGKFSTIYRASQSKVGVQNSRSPDDELMLRYIGDHQYDPKRTVVNEAANCFIYDARAYYAALGMKIAGKGYESEQYYPNCKINFLNIPNIHAVRNSYNKVIRAAFGEDSKFFTALAESEWYDFVFLILEGSMEIVQKLMAGINVLVHCSDGWDRTAQLCSLASMILDPYYRTMEGFQILIEKDWIRFGHQFGVRLAQGMNDPQGEEKSQVFLQFLDCVSQLLYQFPSDFQFNFIYLQQISQLAYCHLYGTFLCNNEQEIKKYGLESKTISVWSYFRRHKDHLLNPFYLRRQVKYLDVSTAQKHMRFWKEHFLQFVEGFKDIYDIYSCKFTEDNLEIMYKHLKKEKFLLEERAAEYEHILKGLDEEIKNRTCEEIAEIPQKQKEEMQMHEVTQKINDLN